MIIEQNQALMKKAPRRVLEKVLGKVVLSFVQKISKEGKIVNFKNCGKTKS